jgi:hypothetical protein
MACDLAEKMLMATMDAVKRSNRNDARGWIRGRGFFLRDLSKQLTQHRRRPQERFCLVAIG